MYCNLFDLKNTKNNHGCGNPVVLNVDVGDIVFMGSIYFEKNVLCQNAISAASWVPGMKD